MKESCIVKTTYPGLEAGKEYTAHYMVNPSGVEYYRVFFDDAKPELYYIVLPEQIAK